MKGEYLGETNIGSLVLKISSWYLIPPLNIHLQWILLHLNEKCEVENCFNYVIDTAFVWENHMSPMLNNCHFDLNKDNSISVCPLEVLAGWDQ